MDIEELLYSEQADLDDLQRLQELISDLQQLRIVNDLFARKTERVIALTLMLEYKDTQGKDQANGHELSSEQAHAANDATPQGGINGGAST